MLLGALTAPMAAAAPPPQPQPSPSRYASPWTKYVDEEGDAYYCNVVTQETTWARPPGFVDVDETAAVATTKLLQAEAELDALLDTGGNRRVLVISTSVVKLQSQLILGAAREDVTVVLFDGSATSPSTLVGMIQAAVPRGGRLAKLGFMTQSSVVGAVCTDGTAVLELVRGQAEQTTRRSLRSDPALKQFWRDVGALMAGGARIDLLKSSIGRASDGAWLLADLEQLTNCALTAEESLVESSGDNYFDMASLSLLIRGSAGASGAASGPPFTVLPTRSPASAAYPQQQWEPPSALLQRERVLPGSGERAYPLTVPPSPGSGFGTSPAQTCWRRYFDEDGDAYYVDAESGETTWATPAQFVDPPKEQRAIAERRFQAEQSAEEGQRLILEEHRRVVQEEASEQVAMDRRAVQEALAQVEQISRTSAETLGMAKIKLSEAAGLDALRQSRSTPEPRASTPPAAAVQLELYSRLEARGPEEEVEFDGEAQSPSELAQRASVNAQRAKLALARERMAKEEAQLRLSEEAAAKVEARAELERMREQMATLEAHVAEESNAGAKAVADLNSSQAEGRSNEADARAAIAAAREEAEARGAETMQAKEQAEALAARISGLVEESLSRPTTLVRYKDSHGEPYFIDAATGARTTEDGSALVGIEDRVREEEIESDMVLSVEQRVKADAERVMAEQMREVMRASEMEKVASIAAIEAQQEALVEQKDALAAVERERREVAEAEAEKWRLKAAEAERELAEAAEAEQAAREELRSQGLGDKEAAQEKKEMMERASKAEAAEQQAKGEARAAQAKFVEHQNVLEKETRARKDLEEQIKFEVEAGRASEEARIQTQWELAKAKELLKKQEEGSGAQLEAMAAQKIKVEEERKLAEDIKTQAETVRAQSDAEQKRLGELAEMASREAAEHDQTSKVDRMARTVAEQKLIEEERRRQEAEARAREVEWALEKAEQLLRAHEETADFYMTKARDEAAKASKAENQKLHMGHMAAEMTQVAQLATIGQLSAVTQGSDAMSAARAFQAQAQAQNNAAQAREVALTQQVSYAVEEMSSVAMLSIEEVKSTARMAAQHAVGEKYAATDGEMGSPVDNVMQELGKFHTALEQSDSKNDAALRARESAESNAKSATDQAMAAAEKATGMVDTLADELKRTREAQEQHKGQVAELVTARAQAEERNAAMVRQLAEAQARLEQAMKAPGGPGSGAASLATGGYSPMFAAAANVGTTSPSSSDASSAAGAGFSGPEMTLHAALNSHESGEIERMQRQKEGELKELRQTMMAQFYAKQQWFVEQTQNPVSSWNGGAMTDLRPPPIPVEFLVPSVDGQIIQDRVLGGLPGNLPGGVEGLRGSIRTAQEKVSGVIPGAKSQPQVGAAPFAYATGVILEQGPLAGQAPPPPAWGVGGGGDSSDGAPPPPPPPDDSSDDDAPPPPPPPPMDDDGPPPPPPGPMDDAPPPPPPMDDDGPPPPPPMDDDGPPPPPPPESYPPPPSQQHAMPPHLGQPPAAAPPSPSGQTAKLLSWVAGYGSDYDVVVQSFGASFNDGLAFCAILAGAQLLDWGTVQLPANNIRLRQQNLELAFGTAQSALGLAPLLDAAEMAATGSANGKYDERSVMTYIIELQRRIVQRGQGKIQNPMAAAAAEDEEMSDETLNAMVAANLQEEKIEFDM